MNKETRIFILGMFLFIVCAFGTAINIYNLTEGKLEGGVQWVAFICCIFGTISGCYFIDKSIS